MQPHKGLLTALRSLLFNIIIIDLFTKSIRKLTFTVERSFMDKTNKIAMEILNAKKRVDNRAEVKDMCDECKYNTGDYVCHPHCSGCDGRSKHIHQN